MNTGKGTDGVLFFMETDQICQVDISNPVTVSYHEICVPAGDVVAAEKDAFTRKGITAGIHESDFKMIDGFSFMEEKIRFISLGIKSKIRGECFLVEKEILDVIGLVAKG